MPTITRYFIKTAMLHALAGVLLTALWLTHLARPIHPLVAYLQPTALHLVVVGWLTQMIIGVALWMFPPWSRTLPRGPEHLGRLCYAMLNVGLVLRVVAEPASAYSPSPVFALFLVASAVLQVMAVWLFVTLAWPRVRGKATTR